MVFNEKTLFIGCGDGSEILPFVSNPNHLLIGLEPIGVLYESARKLLSSNENVRIVNSSIQSWKNHDHETGFNQIYMLFPPPVIMLEQAESIIDRVYELLSEYNGVFCLVSEVTMSGWLVPSDINSLKKVSGILNDGRFEFTVTEMHFDRLPELAKKTHCGVLFRNHNVEYYTVIYSKKLITQQKPVPQVMKK